jgi:hypothetical protein
MRRGQTRQPGLQPDNAKRTPFHYSRKVMSECDLLAEILPITVELRSPTGRIQRLKWSEPYRNPSSNSKHSALYDPIQLGIHTWRILPRGCFNTVGNGLNRTL